jgi:hypothetical protein
MFDSCAYWGHHEGKEMTKSCLVKVAPDWYTQLMTLDIADLGICRNPRYRLGKPYIDEYLKHMPVSEPIEDFHARNALYAFKYHVLLSVIYHKDPAFRVM